MRRSILLVLILSICSLALSKSIFRRWLNLFDDATQDNDEDQHCYTVRAGDFYPTTDTKPHIPIIYHGFSSEANVSKRVKLDPEGTTHYIIPNSNPKAHMCETSWNKLFGTTRCGYLNSNHQDSDRFVWRRA